MSRMSLHYDFVKQPSLQAQIGPTLSYATGSVASVLAADGYIKYVPSYTPRFTGAALRQNLLVYSTDFSSAWTDQRVNRSASDGTLFLDGTAAVKITNDGQVGNSGINKVNSVDIVPYGRVAYVMSCYMKAGTNTWGMLMATTGGEANYIKGFFNLDAGSVGSELSGGSGFSSDGIWISDEGDGWYRCAVAFHTDSTNAFTSTIRIADADQDHSIAGAGTESIYIRNAQLEQVVYGQVEPSAYIPTGATAVCNGEYVDTIASHVERKGLLVEEARTNICLQSEDFNTTWTKGTGCAVNTNQAIAPDGSLTADQLIDDGSELGPGTVDLYQALGFSTNTPYTFSCFMKADQLSWSSIQLSSMASLAVSAFYDLSNGVVGATVGADVDATGIEDYGNGWYRCWLSFTTDLLDDTGNFAVLPADGDGDVSVDWDGTSSIFVWGGQVEAAAAPSSYIPTTTVSVTRAVDLVTSTDVTWLDETQGTFYVEAAPTDASNAGDIVCVDDGSSADYHVIANNDTTAFQALTRVTSVTQGNVAIGSAFSDDTVLRGIYAAAADDFSCYADGTAATPDTSGTMPTGLTTLRVGNGQLRGAYNGHVLSLAYWDARLADGVMQDISTNGLPGTKRANEITRNHNDVGLRHKDLGKRHNRPTMRHAS